MKNITIGIPAYNEEANIKRLISSVLKQDFTNLKLDKIIISSDGSTDKTVAVAKSFKNKKIVIINNKDRKGIARGLNQIISKSKSEILVTLDADITISDNNFIQKLVSPILNNSASLTSSAIAEKMPKTFYGKILFVSMLLKENLFKAINNGNNIYTCHGLARAYSKKFYQGLTFPASVGNDMYSYLKCVNENLIYKYTESAIAWYKVPENYLDHKKQSTRFFNTIEEQTKYFKKSFVTKQTQITRNDYLNGFYKSIPILVSFPIHSLSYFVLQIYMRLKSNFVSSDEAWSIATSTK